MVSIWLIFGLMVVPFNKSKRKIGEEDSSPQIRPIQYPSFPPFTCTTDEGMSMSYLHKNAKFEDKSSLNTGVGKEKVLYHDEDIIIVDKPPFIQTVPGYDERLSLATIIKDKFNIGSVEYMSPHRLDYLTSGLVVFTRNPNALKQMQQQFRDNAIYKRYTAIVARKMNDWSGEIDLPLGKDKVFGPPLQTVDVKTGKQSVTYWNVCDVGKRATKLNLIPKTGRTHQLRLHAAAIGHPILGDLFYCPPKFYKAADRLLLHAEEMRFTHPRSKVEIAIKVKCPFQLADYDSV